MSENLSDTQLLAAHVKLPQHVVHRNFVEETVVLNLRTGKYHGLNTTAGEMIDAFEQGATPAETASRLAEEYAVEPDQVRADVVALCRALIERELVEVSLDPRT